MPRKKLFRSATVAAGLLFAGAALGWTTADDGEDQKTLIAPRETWRAPVLPSSDPEPALRRLAQHSLWEVAARPPAAAALTESAQQPSWRLAGIADDNGPPVAVILVIAAGQSGSTAQYRHVGDLLPDGSRIIEITATTITVQSAGLQRRIRLFSRE